MEQISTIELLKMEAKLCRIIAERPHPGNGNQDPPRHAEDLMFLADVLEDIAGLLPHVL